MTGAYLHPLAAARPRPKGSAGMGRSLSIASGLLLGALLALTTFVPVYPRISATAAPGPAGGQFDIERLSPDEIQSLIVRALATLAERQAIAEDGETNSNAGRGERLETPRDVREGIQNMRRLLHWVKGWTRETLRTTLAGCDLRPQEWSSIDRLIDRVHKILPVEHLRGIAAIRDDRPSEILVDPAYAADLNYDDDAVFVLAHELTHVAARSGALNSFIEGAAESVRMRANVRPTENQQEDLVCDLVAQLVLRRFIANNPARESEAVRVSQVLGYASQAERFALAWEDFRASYNGDPGDDSHLSGQQTIRALLALDPELSHLMPNPGCIIPFKKDPRPDLVSRTRSSPDLSSTPPNQRSRIEQDCQFCQLLSPATVARIAYGWRGR